METNEEKRVIRKGYWKYDNSIIKGVIVVAINYDYWYELEKADGFDMTNEKPELNENGEMYMIEWTDKDFEKQESFSAGTHQLLSTIEQAEKTTGQKIEWIIGQ